jgi:predicted SprT family Zn-dependent metalloprotease
MDVTEKLLKEKFDEYNRMYCEGKLKNVKMGFIRKSFKRTVGEFEFYIDKDGYFRYASIKVNKGIDWDGEKLRRILLHEMAHLSVTQKYKKNKKHGIAFIKECKRIESQYNVKVWHSWMKKGYINKRESIFSLPFILCYHIASIVKFRIIQRII